MLADHAAGILARGTRLGTKAGRDCRDPHRESRLLQDGFAHEICQRHFGRGNEPELFLGWRLLNQFSNNLFWRFTAFGDFLIQWFKDFLKPILSPFHLGRDELIISKFRQLTGPKHHLVAYEEWRVP